MPYPVAAVRGHSQVLSKTPLQKFVVAFWPFQADGSDATGRGNDLTLNNTPTFTAGLLGNALTLVQASHQSATATRTADTQIGSGDFYACAWVYQAAIFADNMPIIAPFDAHNSTDYMLYVQGGTLAWLIKNLTQTTVLGGMNTAHVWYFVECYYDYANQITAVRATKKPSGPQMLATPWATHAQTVRPPNTSIAFAVGAYAVNTTPPFSPNDGFLGGQIDEVQIRKSAAAAGGIPTKWESAQLWNLGSGLTWPLAAPTLPSLPLDILVMPAGSGAAGHQGFPILIKLSNGTWHQFWRSGTSHASLDGTIKHASAGLDSFNYAPEADLETSASRRLCPTAIIQLANGNVLRFVMSATTEPDYICTCYISTDNCATWDAGHVVSVLDKWTFSFGRPYQLASGTIILPVYGQATADSDPVTRSVLAASTDGGLTWSLYGTIASDGATAFDETSIINTSGTNWLAIVRSDTAPGHSWATHSTNDGVTWDALSDIGFYANAPELCYDGSGNLFMFYRSFTTPNYGYSWRKSADNGLTWGSENDIYTSTNFDGAYSSAVFYGTNFYLAYFKPASNAETHLYINAAASM